MQQRIVLGGHTDPKFPIEAFFNSINDSSFVDAVTALVKHIGYCYNDSCCLFPGDLDPNDEIFEGVKFCLFKNEVIIEEELFGSYLKMACNVYVELNPNDENKIHELLKSY